MDIYNFHKQIYYVNNKNHTERFILSHECNLKCSYCFQIKKKHQILSIDAIQRRIELLKLRLLDVNWMMVDLFGGEPMLNWNAFTYITEQFKDNKKVYLSTITNGTLLNEDRVKYLSEISNFKLDISFDGNRQSNKFRKDYGGNETFDLVLKNVNLLQKYDINFLMKTTLGNFNFESIFDSLKFLKSIGIKNIYLQCIDNPVSLRINEDQMNELINFIEDIKDDNFDINVYNGFYSKKNEFKDKVEKIDTLRQWNITQPNGITYSYIQGGPVGVRDYEQFNINYNDDLDNTNLLDILDLNNMEYRKIHDLKDIEFAIKKGCK